MTKVTKKSRTKKHIRKEDKAKMKKEAREAKRRGEFRMYLSQFFDAVYMREIKINDALDEVLDVIFGEMKLKAGYKLKERVMKVKIEPERSPSKRIEHYIGGKLLFKTTEDSRRWKALLKYLDKKAGF